MKCKGNRTERPFNPFKKRRRFAPNEKPECEACNDYGYVRRETWNAEVGWEIQACSRCNHELMRLLNRKEK